MVHFTLPLNPPAHANHLNNQSRRSVRRTDPQRARRTNSKGTGEPYFNHVKRVAAAASGIDANTLAWQRYVVGLAHDCLEDNTGITEDQIRAHLQAIFPDDWFVQCECMIAILLLTKYQSNDPKAKERAKKKFDYTKYVYAIKANPIAKAVKLADLADNMTEDVRGNMYDKYHLTRSVLLGEAHYCGDNEC